MELQITEMIINYFSGFWGKVELFGTIFSVICVYLAAKHNQLTWIFGAAGVILFGALFYEFKLYSDAGLQVFFLVMQVYGFMTWKRMAEESENESITLGLSVPAIALIVGSIGTLTGINGYFMSTYTDASFPYADALTTWMSIFAQILMIKKFWESWVIWVAMDAIAIFIYAAKGLYVVSGLYAVFLVMAAYGLVKWRKDFKEQEV